ncbi:MAG: NlpC/P60 family protein [Flavobacteriales bacterium]
MHPVICQVVVAPVRAEASDKSEIVSQLLFGELAQVLEELPRWAKVRCSHDGYEGYIDPKQLKKIDSNWVEKFTSKQHTRLNNTIAEADCTTGKINLVKGSVLPFYTNGMFYLGEEAFYLPEGNRAPEKDICTTALSYLNAPYLWGGRSPFGIDCSGFTQVVFSIHGITLPRDAYQQAELGETINLINETLPGDLAYFDNEEGKIIHVGIVLEGNRIIHASGKVRIDKLDHQGIFNEETGSYSHQLRVVKRVTPPAMP